MTFRFIAPDAIRSTSQRALLEQWDRLAAGRPFPAFAELRPDPAMHDPRQLVAWAVEGEGRLRKFRAMYQGENVAEVFNCGWAGKTMEQVVPMSLRRITLGPAKESAASGCAVYMVFSTVDANDQQVDCERLLLPFGNGLKVEHLLASLQLTVIGSRPRILKHFDMQSEVRLQGRIRSGFLTGATSEVAGDQRRASRRNVARAARISFARRSVTCFVRNLSASGAAVETTDPAEIPDSFRLVLEMEATERRCRVVWRRKGRIGVQFS
ncbi:PilZ domain-containing protein [Bradyrhizobium acaciae]|uniref:PilZ domain-containing protein n=1 Tax=Bradyrhizobium acaciae TaxID=2683706 RepID=UPI001E2D516D|nr:PilZ domain-containing protein [Bradyrhizobium acaciae]MCC8983217.1 PilZ domain-containing protein [Bradyrhizobium acaciae]